MHYYYYYYYTPPCFTPFLTVKQFVTACPHLTLSVLLVYMYTNNVITNVEILRFKIHEIIDRCELYQKLY